MCVTERGHAVVPDVLRERDSWLGRAMQTLLDEEEQRIPLAAGALMERLAAFEAAGAPAPAAPVGPR
ncbi:hypothetical protein [Streptomyces sp. DW26H14]|uniref:hypothetical protein n=1 Tax=Streptomyces sp. DW26H14 TaxID=3435395 RepID=UPI00403DA7CA